MYTSEVVYQGQLRTIATHLQSGNHLLTDAPTDNHGLGANFSPTDLVATALGSCMLTILGIEANASNLNLEQTSVNVLKVMGSGPRRIIEIKIEIYFKQKFNDSTRGRLERLALACPVAKSLHPDIKQDVVFYYPN